METLIILFLCGDPQVAYWQHDDHYQKSKIEYLTEKQLMDVIKRQPKREDGSYYIYRIDAEDVIKGSCA